jgi:hypothetical protein
MDWYVTCDLRAIHADGKIIAWCDVHVVIWKYQTGKHGRIWTVQSTLQSSDPITTLDYKEGRLYHLEFTELAKRKEHWLWELPLEFSSGEQVRIGTSSFGIDFGPGMFAARRG